MPLRYKAVGTAVVVEEVPDNGTPTISSLPVPRLHLARCFVCELYFTSAFPMADLCDICERQLRRPHTEALRINAEKHA